MIFYPQLFPPVCLPPANANQHAGKEAVIMGWGPESNVIIYFFFLKLWSNNCMLFISVPGTASTSLRHGKVKVGLMSICKSMESSYSDSFSVYLSYAWNICVISQQATLPNKFSCLVRKWFKLMHFIFDCDSWFSKDDVGGPVVINNTAIWWFLNVLFFFNSKADIGGPVVIDTRPYNYKDDTRQMRFPSDQYTLPIVYPIHLDSSWDQQLHPK